MLQSSRCSSRFQLQLLKKKKEETEGGKEEENEEKQQGRKKKQTKKKFLQLCTLCSCAVALKAVMKRQAVELLEVIADPFSSHTHMRVCALP